MLNNRIDEYIGRIGQFEIQNEGAFPGFLSFDDIGDVILNLQIPIENRRKMKKERENLIIGTIFSTPVTLFRSIIIESSTKGFPCKNVDLKMKPSAIVIGANYKGEVQIKSIDAMAPHMNDCFRMQTQGKMENDRITLSIEFDELLNITAKEANGVINVYSTVSTEYKETGASLAQSFYFSYSSKESVTLFDGLGKVFSCRNLFAFFMNDNIDLSNFNFIDSDNNHCSLLLNYLRRTKEKSDYSIVSANYIKNNFEEIWNNWVEMERNCKGTIELFYGIFSDQSFGTNQFLNYCQAIESFTRGMRKEQVEEIRNLYMDKYDKEYYEKNKKAKDKGEVQLKHRIHDCIKYSNVMEDDETKIVEISRKIKDARIYYTHYKENVRRPMIEEIFNYNHFLRWVLLNCIYKQLGIPEENIVIPSFYRMEVEAMMLNSLIGG